MYVCIYIQNADPSMSNACLFICFLPFVQKVQTNTETNLLFYFCFSVFFFDNYLKQLPFDYISNAGVTLCQLLLSGRPNYCSQGKGLFVRSVLPNRQAQEKKQMVKLSNQHCAEMKNEQKKKRTEKKKKNGILRYSLEKFCPSRKSHKNWKKERKTEKIQDKKKILIRVRL